MKENKLLANYPKDGVKISVNFSKDDYEELLDIETSEKLDHQGIVKMLITLNELNQDLKHAANRVFDKYKL